ncbi:hypothetical protein [Qaidamihabitans albus]|uniref:hypothetical protein n=1 Tax=Qaidamihabitans albus TaxID=2795733 RepID=UPI0018F23CB2|nr:hypothetical protein [Qaidamihabitans albus]
MPDYVPAHLRAPLASFETALADFRTQRIRLEQREVPDTPAVDAEKLAEAAERPDAPEKLKAVARAVAEGRATWDDVAEGRVEAAPEVRELFAASGPGIVRGMAEAEEEEARLADAEADRQRAARRADEDEEEDFSQRDFLNGGW